MRTTVVYHSADMDGIFCREIAKHFLGPGSEQEPNEYIGWNFGDPKVQMPAQGQVYVLDLPPSCLSFGETSVDEIRFRLNEIIWIDHHKTSIDEFSADIPGYRIDGVAACRLAWQWFQMDGGGASESDGERLPCKEDFLNRKVSEPLAVRLAGEYDVWDHRGDGDLELQFGLRTVELKPAHWTALFSQADAPAKYLMERGAIAKAYAEHIDANLVKYRSFRVKWEGLDFLCLNTGRFNSLTFAAQDKPETGHDALLGFFFNGKQFIVSLYHANHNREIDLSAIAKKYGGGGHRGACGFQCDKLPFL